MLPVKLTTTAALGFALLAAPLAAQAQTGALPPVASQTPEPLPVPDARQRQALASLMATPEVADAVARLTDVQSGDGLAAGYPLALSALQRAQRADAPTDQDARPVVVIEGAVAAPDGDAAAAAGGPDLGGVGLGSLALLAVGMQLGDDQVIALTAGRVVIQRAGGQPVLWHDDDANLHDPQSPRWIEVYADGSILSRWQRADGSWTVSIRDATGRALWRERILADGLSISLFNDLAAGLPVDQAALPTDPVPDLRLDGGGDPALSLAELAEAETAARGLARHFSLRQVRETRALRDLLPILGPVEIAFGVNSDSVSDQQGATLAAVGGFIAQLIASDPREMFLIEGHTDATGTAAHNLTLSDRRAASVAQSLSDGFAIPAENLIIQGYGARHPRLSASGADAGNRRVVIRRISPLLGP
jgi:outer membrane protein OmpA-like peptidoglycan-associated protein